MAHSQVVDEVVKDWQNRLLQLDRRNRLLYFKPTPRGQAHELKRR